MFKKQFVALLMCALLGACATPYQSSGMTGGYSEQELEPGIWRLAFNGNGHATRETVQTYWLYRAAELTTEKGYDGFELLSAVPFVGLPQAPIQLAASGPVYIPMYYNTPVAMPKIEADIRMVRKPVAMVPGKVFDAAVLKADLEPYVQGKKCDKGNVCPHVHRYLLEKK